MASTDTVAMLQHPPQGPNQQTTAETLVSALWECTRRTSPEAEAPAIRTLTELTHTLETAMAEDRVRTLASPVAASAAVTAVGASTPVDPIPPVSVHSRQLDTATSSTADESAGELRDEIRRILGHGIPPGGEMAELASRILRNQYTKSDVTRARALIMAPPQRHGLHHLRGACVLAGIKIPVTGGRSATRDKRELMRSIIVGLRHDDAEPEVPGAPTPHLALRDAVLRGDSVAIECAVQPRFAKPGWFRTGPIPIRCPRCRTTLVVYRCPNPPKVAEGLYWAFVCTTCRVAYELDALGPEAKRVVYRNRATHDRPPQRGVQATP